MCTDVAMTHAVKRSVEMIHKAGHVKIVGSVGYARIKDSFEFSGAALTHPAGRDALKVYKTSPTILAKTNPMQNVITMQGATFVVQQWRRIARQNAPMPFWPSFRATGPNTNYGTNPIKDS